MKSPKFICITGPDGSGKSTLILNILERIKKDSKYSIEMITIWDMLLYNPETRKLLGLSKAEDYDKYLRLLHPISRSLFLFHIFHQSMKFAEKKEADIFIIDSYWYKYYATEIAHGADKNLIYPITNIFKEPDATFFINVTPEIAYSRKDKCSGYEIGYADPQTEEAFLSFQGTAYKMFNELKKEKNWINLDGTDSIENIVNKTYSEIMELMS